MKILTKGFWTKRAAAPPQPARAATPPPLPQQKRPIDISKLKGRDKAAALIEASMKPELVEAKRVAAAAEADKKAEALRKLHAHAVKQGELSSKRARGSYFTLHRQDIDAAIKASGENTNKWYAVFLA